MAARPDRRPAARVDGGDGVAHAQVAATSGVAVSVHGPAGVLDLLVPAEAQVLDVAREYARETGLAAIPLVHDSLGRPLVPTATLEAAGIEPGHVLVAATAVHRSRGEAPAPPRGTGTGGSGAVATLMAAGASAAAALAGVAGAAGGGDHLHRVVVAILATGALLGVLPVGRAARSRALAAPAFGAAAVLTLLWSPEPAQWPVVVGLVALAGAAVAGVARALHRQAEEGLRVWILAGTSVFGLTALLALLDQRAAVAWSLLVAGAMLASRFAPGLVVDVPDQYLLDLERLAVTAWSARSRPPGRRGRVVVPERLVREVATRGTRLITATAAAVSAVAVVASVGLLDSVGLTPDRYGALALVGLAGTSLLLVARTHRHGSARNLLRLGGLAMLALLVGDLLVDLPTGWVTPLVVLSVLGVVLLVVAAVAAGRGWRSAGWARRAELAEGLSSAGALAAVVVSSGFFRVVAERATQ